MYEFYALIGVVVVFAILFAVGLRANSNALVKYAEQIRNVSSPFCKFVGFRRYSRGFKALCIPKEGGSFSRIDVTLSLTWRENPMFYLLSPILKDKDHIFVWGTLTRRYPINVQVCKREYFKQLKLDKSFEKIDLSRFDMVVVTDDVDRAKNFIGKIEGSLSASKNCISLLSIKEDEAWVKVVGDIVDEQSIKCIFDLLMQSGYVIEDSSKSL
jgi:hypothetical protein